MDKQQALKLFDVPGEFSYFAETVLSEDEIKLILIFGNETLEKNLLSDKLKEAGIENPEALIDSSYRRAIIDKACEHGSYRVSTFDEMLLYIAQYEPHHWHGVDEDDRIKIRAWHFDEYMHKNRRPKIERLLKGEIPEEHDQEYLSLQETLDMVDAKTEDIYIQPCNCRCFTMGCEEPTEVCIQFGKGINTPADRGHGRLATKEQAKDIITSANKRGLMQSYEQTALCNCCGDCCYPVRAGLVMNSVKIWPYSKYKISVDFTDCKACGKCVKTCNYRVFTMENGKVSFDDSKCYGCTICADKCPKQCIRVVLD